MALVSTKIVVPQHIEYLIVDRELLLVEHSPNISRFFPPNQLLSRGQDLRELIPELFTYQQTLQNLLNCQQEHFYLPKINFNVTSNIYFTIHITQHKLENRDRNYLIVFLEDITNYGNWEQSLLSTIDEYNLLHDSSQLWNQLAQSNYFYERILASMAEALIITSDTGAIQLVNQTAINLLGYTQAELVDRSINKIIADTSFPLSEIQHYLLTQGELLKNIEVNCQTKQGLTKTISFTCSRIKTEENDSCTFIYLGRDITKIKCYQQRQTVQYLVSKILANSQDLSQAAPQILQVICENLDLALGEVWIENINGIEKQHGHLTVLSQDGAYKDLNSIRFTAPPQNPCPLDLSKSASNLEEIQKLPVEQSQDNLLLKCQAIWAKEPDRFSQFIEVTQKNILRIGEGIAGNIWQNKSFCRFQSFTKKLNFPRQDLAIQSGLKGGFSFPIQNGNSILAVMNFFLDRERDIDENLVDLMLIIANQISQFIQRVKAELGLKNKQKESEKLLLNILPSIIAKQLKQQNSTIANHFEKVTILFADLVDFTNWFTQLSPIEVVEILNEIFSEFDCLSTKYGLEKIKTIGDAYMVVGGLPQQQPDHAEAIAEMALDMQQAIAQFNQETDKTLSIRIGINTGAVVAGVIGTKKFSYDLWGDAVNIARRMESQGIPDHIQVTTSTYELLKYKYYFQSRGKIDVKGKGKMSTYLLMGRKLV